MNTVVEIWFHFLLWYSNLEISILIQKSRSVFPFTMLLYYVQLSIPLSPRPLFSFIVYLGFLSFLFRFSRANRLFAGLWFGKGKPHFPTFMKPFCQSVRYLYTEGKVFLVTDLIVCKQVDCNWEVPTRYSGTPLYRHLVTTATLNWPSKMPILFLIRRPPQCGHLVNTANG